MNPANNVNDLIRDIKERPKPFYGRTTIVWQKGKMIRWEYQGSKKPKDES